MNTTDRLTDEQWLIQHLEDDAEACSAVNGSKDITTKDARRAEVTVKRVIRERDEARRASQEAPAPRKTFPILKSGGATVDYQLVADHGKQAQANHYQSVERLAQRGGLSWSELYAVLHDQKWRMIDDNDAINSCRGMEAAYLRAQSAPAPSDGLREALLRWCDDRQADVLGCIDLNASEEAAAVMWLNNFRAALSEGKA